MGLRATTARSYRMHIDRYLTPHLGHLRLREVSPTDVQDLLTVLSGPREGVRLSPSSVRRVHATLRSALGTAKRRRLISYNPAADVDLPPASRPRVRPWEAVELGRFLDYAAADRLGALFEVIAATGLRRGESLGLRWEDVDLERGRLVVRRQVIQVDAAGRQPCPYCGQAHAEAAFGRPKTASGEDRIVDLDTSTVGVLLGHRLAQDAERATHLGAYVDHGLIFAQENGDPIPPQRVTARFRQLVAETGLPRIRLHDLRHGQASLMLAAGVPMAVVSKRLGHSSISITSDTYSHLLEGVGREAAEAAMRLVPRTRTTLNRPTCHSRVGTWPVRRFAEGSGRGSGDHLVPPDARLAERMLVHIGLPPASRRLDAEHPHLGRLRPSAAAARFVEDRASAMAAKLCRRRTSSAVPPSPKRTRWKQVQQSK